MTLLLGPPSSGKTTLLLALAGKLHPDLKISGSVTYNGHGMHEFVPHRTAVYINQNDYHIRELTLKETLAFSARCQGVGFHYEMLAKLSRREKEAYIKPDPDIDLFMKGPPILLLMFLHILLILQACSPETGIANPRDFVIARIGCFFELECQEWQKALYSIGGIEVRKWPIQLRRSTPDGIPPNSNGNTLQQQELSMIQDRTMPSSPSPLYSSHSKASSYMKDSMGQPSARKQLIGGHTAVGNSRGLLQWV